MYDAGQGVAQNYAEAFRWYTRSAEQGEPKAQFNLGAMYEVGHGVVQDTAEAMRWYRKAAAQGDQMAQFRLDSVKPK
jgi:TPR repeat protein